MMVAPLIVVSAPAPGLRMARGTDLHATDFLIIIQKGVVLESALLACVSCFCPARRAIFKNGAWYVSTCVKKITYAPSFETGCTARNWFLNTIINYYYLLEVVISQI
jgi:hypothetical protein